MTQNDPQRARISPSMDQWIQEAKKEQDASQVGMYLFHNGVVRETPKVQVREGIDTGKKVSGMDFSYDAHKVKEAIEETRTLPGIFHVRAWLAEGHLQVGDDIMYILVGGDIRPHVIDALQHLVGRIKTECVTETEGTDNP